MPLLFFLIDRNQPAPPCDGNYRPGLKPEHFRLHYDVYQMFLDEGDLSEEGLFDGLEKMAYPDVIKTNGKKVGSTGALTQKPLRTGHHPPNGPCGTPWKFTMFPALLLVWWWKQLILRNGALPLFPTQCCFKGWHFEHTYSACMGGGGGGGGSEVKKAEKANWLLLV